MNGFKEFFVESTLGSHNNIDTQIVQLYLSGKKVGQIEQDTGKWRSYIYGVLKREGVSPYRLNQQRELTIQLGTSGVSAKKIAEITSQTERNVREVINKHRKNGHGITDQRNYWSS